MNTAENEPTCLHENEEIMVCIYPGCQADDLAACRKCMLTSHQHGLYKMHSQAIRSRIGSFMNVVRKRAQI